MTQRVEEVYFGTPHRLQSIVLSSDNRSIGVSLSINEADLWLASARVTAACATADSPET